jgi:hypothetical protein
MIEPFLRTRAKLSSELLSALQYRSKFMTENQNRMLPHDRGLLWRHEIVSCFMIGRRAFREVLSYACRAPASVGSASAIHPKHPARKISHSSVTPWLVFSRPSLYSRLFAMRSFAASVCEGREALMTLDGL